jgi:hypothetical protein
MELFEYLDILGGMLLKGRGLSFVDGHILGHHILALHSFLTRKTSHHHCNVHILASLGNIGCGNHTCN